MTLQPSAPIKVRVNIYDRNFGSSTQVDDLDVWECFFSAEEIETLKKGEKVEVIRMKGLVRYIFALA